MTKLLARSSREGADDGRRAVGTLRGSGGRLVTEKQARSMVVPTNFPKEGNPMEDKSLSWEVLVIAWSLAIAALTGMTLQPSPALAQTDDLKQSGTLTINQTQLAFIVSGNIGGGTLSYAGATHAFSVGGLGIGGIGVSQIDAVGEVYNLKNLTDFEGAYGQARTGIAIGTVSAGHLWLENTAGVYIHLAAKRTGLALSLGADAVYIKFD